MAIQQAEDSFDVSTLEFDGPFTDSGGEYWQYRGWRIESVSCAEFPEHPCIGVRDAWVAFPSLEMSNGQAWEIWRAANGFVPQGARSQKFCMGVHRTFETPSIQAKIDQFMGQVEAAFREAMRDA